MLRRLAVLVRRLDMVLLHCVRQIVIGLRVTWEQAKWWVTATMHMVVELVSIFFRASAEVGIGSQSE